MENEKVVVIGAGQMGSQIAALSAMAGLDTNLYDEDQGQLEQKIEFTRKNIANLIQKEKLSQEHGDNFDSHLLPCSSLEDSVKGRTFAIEAVTERLDIKNKVFSYLSENTDENTVLASNSSFIAGSQLSEVTNCPSRVLNMHFFYPPIRMDLIEVAYSPQVEQSIIDRTVDLGNLMGRKVVVLKKETPGFIVNRMLAALADEAFELYKEGIASFEDIDIAIENGLGHPKGPYRLADYSGLDIHYYAKLKLAEESGDESLGPPDFLSKRVKEGDLGVKSGKGFYDYSKNPPEPTI